MAPTPQMFLVADYVYKTPATLPTDDTVLRDIDLHTRYGHPEVQQPAAPVQAGGGPGGDPTPDKLPNPQIGEGASQSDWLYFQSRWDRYKKSTRLEGQQAIDQMWACASD